MTTPIADRLGACSHPGRERTENQDSMAHVALPCGDLLLVADGMGGHTGGATASRLAVDTIATYARKCALDASRPDSFREMLWYALAEANSAVYAYAQEHPEMKGMGTTVVAALVVGNEVYVAHVGDSRLYYLNPLAGRVTRDHTTVQEMIDHKLINAEQAKSHPEAHKLLKAIGHKPEVEPEVRPEPVRLAPGDAVLLCSDGLYDVVSDDEIGSEVLTTTPQQSCAGLIKLANQRGGPDNVTVMIYRQPGGKRRAYTTAILRTGGRRWLRVPVAAWVGLAAAVVAAGLALLLFYGGETPPKRDTRVAPPSHEESPRPTRSSPHGTGAAPVQPASNSSEKDVVAQGEDAESEPDQRDDKGLDSGNKISLVSGASGPVHMPSEGDPSLGPAGGSKPEPRKDSGKGTPSGSGQSRDGAQSACSPDGTEGEETKKRIARYQEQAQKSRESLAGPKYYEGGDRFVEAAKELSSDPGARNACKTDLEALAHENRQRRLAEIRKHASGDCKNACEEALRGLPSCKTDCVRHEMLRLDEKDVSLALGACIDKPKCEKVRELLKANNKAGAGGGGEETKGDPQAPAAESANQTKDAAQNNEL